QAGPRRRVDWLLLPLSIRVERSAAALGNQSLRSGDRRFSEIAIRFGFVEFPNAKRENGNQRCKTDKAKRPDVALRIDFQRRLDENRIGKQRGQRADVRKRIKTVRRSAGIEES